MRKVRLNRYERVAGIFVLAALGSAGVIALSSAIRQGWFEARVSYESIFETADGVHYGTMVKMSGLTVGSVRSVELLPENKVKVSFDVMNKFTNRIRSDSTASLIRPFIIGDRVLEITVGSETAELLPAYSKIQTEETMDVMSIMSGRKTSQFMSQFAGVIGSLKIILEAFADKERTNSVVRMFDNLEPMLVKLNTLSEEVIKLSKQMNKDENLEKVMKQAVLLTSELNKIIPRLNEGNPQMGEDLAKLARSLGRITSEMDQAFTHKSDGDSVSTASRLVEALNEATVLIKAMQKSFFVRGSVREVREEESDRRHPANSPEK